MVKEKIEQTYKKIKEIFKKPKTPEYVYRFMIIFMLVISIFIISKYSKGIPVSEEKTGQIIISTDAGKYISAIKESDIQKEKGKTYLILNENAKIELEKGKFKIMWNEKNE